jgi:anaerobic selenocysteine-containing dehydrogenase
MKELRLRIKKRAFPSQGRVRLNESALTGLEIQNGASVDLVNETTSKSISVTVYTDSMVEKGQARVSEEDLKKVGLKDGDMVIVRVTPPLTEKLKKTTDEAAKSVKEGAGKAGAAAKKAGGDLKKATTEGYETVKKKVTKKDNL